MTTLDTPQALYRFYNRDGRLLYVGITGDIGVRWRAHNKRKPWWTEVATCTVEHFATRADAEAAEITAIRTERPLYNVAHNNGGPSAARDPFSGPEGPSGAVPWTFTSLRSGYTKTVPLWLYWEVDGDPVSDEYEPREVDAVELWSLWRRRYPSEPDSGEPVGHKRITWYIEGPGVIESAPGQDDARWRFPNDDHFLAHFTWPVNPKTGDPVRWTALPAVDKLWRPGRADKGGFIQEATGWKPAPFQPYMDVDRIATLARL